MVYDKNIMGVFKILPLMNLLAEIGKIINAMIAKLKM